VLLTEPVDVAGVIRQLEPRSLGETAQRFRLVIRADSSDDVDPACGDVDTSAPPTSALPSSTVAGFARPRTAVDRQLAAAQLSGSGTNDDPFVAPCMTR